mgnify:CR=1 FL=1
MDIIRESLSNFAEVSKNFTNYNPSGRKKHQEDDEYIEEDFEEDIPEDNGDDSGEEELKFEKLP